MIYFCMSAVKRETESVANLDITCFSNVIVYQMLVVLFLYPYVISCSGICYKYVLITVDLIQLQHKCHQSDTIMLCM